MDDALRIVVEMNETIWGRLKNALEDLSEEVIYQEVNILLDAKYPNAEGEVPIGGAY